MRSHTIITVSRSYNLKRRAEQQDETRRRIVEAAIELHETNPPAATSISDIAKRARVGRVTVYRHFPDEAALFRACSGRYHEQYPLPHPDRWRGIADPGERLRTALREVYAYLDTWRSLVREHGLDDEQALDVALRLASDSGGR